MGLCHISAVIVENVLGEHLTGKKRILLVIASDLEYESLMFIWSEVKGCLNAMIAKRSFGDWILSTLVRCGLTQFLVRGVENHTHGRYLILEESVFINQYGSILRKVMMKNEIMHIL